MLSRWRMRCIVPAKYDEEVELWRLPPLGGAGAHRRVFCNICTLLWDCVVGALMLLIAFSTFLVMLLAAVVLVWFIHQL